jgi:hypothetical protein
VPRLTFRSDPAVVGTLKRALRAARSDVVRNCGGWLPRWGCWFVERSCWPAVRRELERAGYRVEYVAAACR